MTKKSEACRNQLEKISDLYNTAEKLIKEVEICQSDLPVPAINELRYAGHHLVKGLVQSDEGIALKAFADAEDHCSRAMYEASESGISYLLDALKRFQSDYKDIPIHPTAPNYLSVRNIASNAAKKLAEGRVKRTSPKEHTLEYMSIFRTLNEGMEKLEIAREELNKVQDRRRDDDRRFLVKLAISTIGSIVTVLSAWAAFWR